MLYSEKKIKNCSKNCLIIIFTSLIALTSCDCDYNYRFIIENKTSSKLTIYCKAGYSYDDEINKTVILNKDTTVLIWSNDVFARGGCPGPYKENCTGLIDSISIIMNDSMITKLNYKDVNNWIFTTNGRSKNSSGNYYISLTDTDFTRMH